LAQQGSPDRLDVGIELLVIDLVGSSS
jgi:hypothetical protein